MGHIFHFARPKLLFNGNRLLSHVRPGKIGFLVLWEEKESCVKYSHDFAHHHKTELCPAGRDESREAELCLSQFQYLSFKFPSQVL